MVESIVIVLAVIVLAIFLWDIRKRAFAHKRCVQKIKEEIAHMTHMTATTSTFADGKANEVLLGVSEDSNLFFYRLIANGKLITHYTLHLPNVLQTILLINGEKRTINVNSPHKTSHMRATDVAKQIRVGLSPEMLKSIKSITLELTFKSEDGSEKVLPVYVMRNPTKEVLDILPKTFENAVWWQQYLTFLSRGNSPQSQE